MISGDIQAHSNNPLPGYDTPRKAHMLRSAQPSSPGHSDAAHAPQLDTPKMEFLAKDPFPTYSSAKVSSVKQISKYKTT